VSAELFVVVDIGCLECHLPSELIGIFTDRDEALGSRAPYEVVPAEDLGENGWHGDGLTVMFTGRQP
jgi:hypothetical protein